MPRKRIRLSRTVDAIQRSIKKHLRHLEGDPAGATSELKQRVDELVALSRDARELSLFHSQHLLSRNSASERILEYLQMNVGDPVEGEALDVIAAISEYPRRIREWRVEFGFPISTRGSAYVLQSLEPNAELADRWKKMNNIRRMREADKKVGDKKKALALFLAFPHQIVTTAQLKYVMASGEMRRVRELRGEDGWRVFTRNTGRPDLKANQYILVDTEQQPEHDREITDAVYSDVLKRDKHQCQKKGCGWTPSQKVEGDRKQYIELHHVTWHSQRGDNDPNNLITLCNVHHRDVHRRRIEASQFREWLNTP